MAEITPQLCPARATTSATHCWHGELHRVGVWRESVLMGTGKEICCWCGERRDPVPTYGFVMSHGPHDPNKLLNAM